MVPERVCSIKRPQRPQTTSPASGWGAWKGEVPQGQLEIRAKGGSCVSSLTLKITGTRKIVRAAYVFNGLHKVHSELFVAGKRVSYGTCG